MVARLADMDLFSIVEEGKVIISDRGVYRQVGLYKRGDTLYAEVKSGFIRLLARGLSTVPHIKWDTIEGCTYREDYNGPKAESASRVRLMAAE